MSKASILPSYFHQVGLDARPLEFPHILVAMLPSGQLSLGWDDHEAKGPHPAFQLRLSQRERSMAAKEFEGRMYPARHGNRRRTVVCEIAIARACWAFVILSHISER